MSDPVRMHIRLPQDVREWLEGLAAQNERSMNWQVVSVLREHMKTNPQRAVKTEANTR